MSDSSANLALPYLAPSQAQKHVTHNEALRLLDILVQLVVETADQAAPPAQPLDGARHIVGTGATGDWSGQDNAVAIFEAGQWQFLAPKAGWQAYVLADRRQVLFDDTDGWQTGLAIPADLPRLGVNATADDTNRLTVAAPSTLLNHDGAGHRLTLNKAAETDTASLLFQTGFSGRAEMGTAGSADFAVKVSDDGADWITALQADAASGTVSLPQGAVIDGSLGGRAIVGTVAASGGAVMESGETANGTYLRLADGTQSCTTEFTVPDVATAIGAIFMSPTFNWFFPKPFVGRVSLFGLGGTTGSWLGGNGASGTVGSLRVLAAVPAAGSITTSVTAIGRWD